MIPQTPRHDLLHELHRLLRPATYLEIGVQTGRGLAQALPGTLALGVDPAPQISVPIVAESRIYAMTSDEYFARPLTGHEVVDLAFIDGMHLVEFALRDFIGVERHARPDGRTVAVFDDVLPYSPDIAGRTPLPGDWAGDVWKVFNALGSATAHLRLILVDVEPTGALVVLGLDPANTTVAMAYEHLHAIYANDREQLPEHQLRRDYAVKPAEALRLVAEHLNITTTEE